MTLKTIAEIASYIQERSPEWMLEDEPLYFDIERQLSDEHPRTFDIAGHLDGAFAFSVYDQSSENKLEEMFVCDIVTSEMIDEALLWEETGKVPVWFPVSMNPLPTMDDDVARAEQRVAALERALVASREELRKAIEVKAAYLTEVEK